MKTNEIIDPFGGVKDIKDGIIRMTTPDSFENDPLRIVRLARFAAQLGFTIEQSTKDSVKAALPLLENVAPERLHDEIMKILLKPEKPSHSIQTASWKRMRSHLLP
jgi:tRNA nucleotidyltransferase/poly(A) polymerase